MIDLYTWSTPNGYKVSIMLEEVGLPYKVHAVNIAAGDQLSAKYLAINPNNKIPAIIDGDAQGGPLTVFESGAVLLYLAEKTGRLLPKDLHGRYAVIEWLMFQMGGVGPMLGQAHYFRKYAKEKVAHAIARYTNEASRLYKVMDGRLAEHDYLAGDYSIADIACFPWVRSHDQQGQRLEDYPNVHRWFKAIDARPAVRKGLAVLADKAQGGPLDDQAESILFGPRQYRTA